MFSYNFWVIPRLYQILGIWRIRPGPRTFTFHPLVHAFAQVDKIIELFVIFHERIFTENALAWYWHRLELPIVRVSSIGL